MGGWGTLAEGVGFEPTETDASAVFKTAALDLSAIPPRLATLQSKVPHVQYRLQTGEVLEWSIRAAC
jgi:hypothetical protein